MRSLFVFFQRGIMLVLIPCKSSFCDLSWLRHLTIHDNLGLEKKNHPPNLDINFGIRDMTMTLYKVGNILKLHEEKRISFTKKMQKLTNVRLTASSRGFDVSKTVLRKRRYSGK